MRRPSSIHPVLWLVALVAAGSFIGAEAMVADLPADPGRFRSALQQFVQRCTPLLANQATGRAPWGKAAVAGLLLLLTLGLRWRRFELPALDRRAVQVAKPVRGARAVSIRALRRGGRYGP